ncbi:heme o synthase [Malassezia vespertilionis]|uniref:Uncharacterized protein n=1 Tax=Malassezia vespertilionis TaxID=2020962 RepID=A0A2N1JAA2_9BASI|nr:heme o synthase [Malassezia vespertilionis]PKI83491.1 hypothetical protein MVES_002640 [Malassezia vespertilionis]WFD07431.1 heme o synthase [Malassezia vespertilionis]
MSSRQSNTVDVPGVHKEQHTAPTNANKGDIKGDARKKPESKLDVTETARKARADMAKQMRSMDEWPHTADDGVDRNHPLVSPTAEDLLKQRFLNAQKRSHGSLSLGGSGESLEIPSVFRERTKKEDGKDTSLMGTTQAPGAATAAGSTIAGGAFASQMRDAPPRKQVKAPHENSAPDAKDKKASEKTKAAALPDPPALPSKKMNVNPLLNFDLSDIEHDGDTADPSPYFPGAIAAITSRPHLENLELPFDTHVLVRRLDEGGWKTPGEKFMEVDGKKVRRHDPAETIMKLTRDLLHSRGKELAENNIDRSDLDNQFYLFSSALAELRTEVLVRARNDAAALRSLASLLQREVDGLAQKMQQEIERLKHDIQVDMNYRKTEVKDENNHLELDIQDLNNRFTIFLSDLRTEIEQSIKWDATRRALALVFGIVAILVCTLALADYLSKDEKYEGEAKKHAKLAAAENAARVTLRDERAPLADEASQPRSAEEWGLLPRYDSDDPRYV